MSYATPAELASFLGQPVDEDRMQLCLDLVTGAIDTAAGSVFTVAPAAVKGVCLRASARVYTNPSGDDAQSLGGQSANYGDTDFLRPGELQIIRGAVTGRGTVYSVPLHTPADVSWPWVETA